MNTTTEYWDVDGVSLNTFAWNIETLGGSRMGVPPLRGENRLVAFRPGRKYLPKLADSRIITLAMWVEGCDEDGVVPVEMEGKFRDNWRTLRRLLWRSDRQYTLTKRLKRGDGSMEVVEALGEYAGGLEPGIAAKGLAKFTVDILLADPYFRPVTGPVTVALGAGGTLNNPGDDTVYEMVITLSGGGPYTLTNTTTGLQLFVDTVGTVVIDTSEGTAEVGGSSVMDKVSVSAGSFGIPAWMYLVRDNNAFTVVGGSAQIAYSPVYL